MRADRASGVLTERCLLAAPSPNGLRSTRTIPGRGAHAERGNEHTSSKPPSPARSAATLSRRRERGEPGYFASPKQIKRPSVHDMYSRPRAAAIPSKIGSVSRRSSESFSPSSAETAHSSPPSAPR